jgi:hypothetical protein
METAFLRWMILVTGQLAGNAPFDIAPPADIAPPVGVLAGISLAAMTVLCLFVGGIILVAFFIIRGIKKNRAAKAASDPGQK